MPAYDATRFNPPAPLAQVRPGANSVTGDRLDTDIAGGVRAGLTTILVLSGIATEADLPPRR